MHLLGPGSHWDIEGYQTEGYLAFEEAQPRDGVPKSVVAARQPHCSVGECGRLCSVPPLLSHCLSAVSASLLGLSAVSVSAFLLGQDLPRGRSFITLCLMTEYN